MKKFIFYIITLLFITACTGQQEKKISLPQEVPKVYKIALLLPSKNPNFTELARSFKDAALLAFEDQNSKIELLIAEFSSDEEAKQATRELIQKKVDFIIGPIHGGTTKEIANLTREAAIPVLSFSNQEDIAGNNIYIFGSNPKQQVDRLLGFMEKQKFAYIAALLPDNYYGKMVHNRIMEDVKAGNISLAHIEFYDMRNIVNIKLAASNLKRLLPQFTAQGRVGIFVPEGGERLAIIAPTLSTIQDDNVVLFGSAWWDDPMVYNNANLKGNLFIGANPMMLNRFRSHFIKQKGYVPPRIASLAYDAASLVASLVEDNDLANINSQAGFKGIEGYFVFDENGVVQRDFSILQIGSNGNINLIEEKEGGLSDD